LKWIIEKIKNFWEATHLMYKIREEKKRGTWTLPYGQTLKLIYLIYKISSFLDDVRHRHLPIGPAGSPQQQPVDLWP
jgi:hypothetical protein